jgi:hypothetical protein
VKVERKKYTYTYRVLYILENRRDAGCGEKEAISKVKNVREKNTPCRFSDKHTVSRSVLALKKIKIRPSLSGGRAVGG